VRRLTLHIEGMSCSHCVNAVSRALAAVPGVRVESVQMGRASVQLDDAAATAEQLEAAVRDAGYRAVAVLEATP
jgi:copper chaperone